MSKIKWYLLFAVTALLAGCMFEPEPAEIDFGKVYVGQSADAAARYKNTSARKADVGVYSVNAPFSVSGAAEKVDAGKNSSPLTATFAPTLGGKFEDEVRPGIVNANEIRATPLKLKGEGVFIKSEGGFALENMPAVTAGSFTFGSAPISPGQAIDWGIRKLGAPPTDAEFFVRNNNAAAVNGTAVVRLLKGDRHFSVTFPAIQNGFNISGAGGTQTREIHVTFTPAAVGDWTDVVEIIDTANPAAKTGVVLKARVVEGE